jgi:hypothetical protein
MSSSKGKSKLYRMKMKRGKAKNNPIEKSALFNIK